MAIRSDRVPVSERGLIQRINRKWKLERREQLLRKSRTKASRELGEFYVLNLKSHRIAARDVDLEELGRKLKVLKGWERLADNAAPIDNIVRRV